MSGHIFVTTAAKKLRHLAAAGAETTLCHVAVICPAERGSRNALTQDRINRMQMCKQCARIKLAADPIPHDPIVAIARPTWITARAQAHARGLTLPEYIQALIVADASEGAELRGAL